MDASKIIDLFKKNPEYLEYEPETILITIADEIKNSPIPDEEFIDLIFGIRSCILSDSAWNYPSVFGNIVDAINLMPVDTSHMSQPSVRDIYRALKVMQKIRPEEDFSDDVISYIGLIALEEGILYIPEMDRVNKFLYSFDPVLQDRIKELYSKLRDKPIESYLFEETPEQIGFLKSKSVTS